MKVIGQLHSQRSKNEMTTSTHNVNQVNKVTSQLTLKKTQLVKQKELFHSTKVARLQVVQEAESKKEKIESDIKYLNRRLMEMAEEVKDAKRKEKDAVWKSSKSSVIISNRIKRLKYLKLLVGELKEELADEYNLQENLHRMSTIRLQIKRDRTIGCQGGYL